MGSTTSGFSAETKLISIEKNISLSLKNCQHNGTNVSTTFLLFGIQLWNIYKFSWMKLLQLIGASSLH